MIGLNQLARAVNATVVGEVAVNDVEHDSRSVRPGALFACIRGAGHDGHDFAGEAIERGAVALLVEAPVPGPVSGPVPNLVVPSVRAALGPAAAEVHGHPSRRLKLVGVTGTNGKTTTVHLLAQILNATGLPCDEIGTLTGARTTPEATEIQRRLSYSVANGRWAVAMEVSSHALAQHRVDGCRFRVAVFTNLKPEHIDFHDTFEDYRAAKARLFTSDLSEQAVVWTGTEEGKWMAKAAKAAKAEDVDVVEVGPDDVQVLELKLGSSRFWWQGLEVEVPLSGRVNVHNAVLAAETAVELGVKREAVARALKKATLPPGRFEIVAIGQNDKDQVSLPKVVVDYAHTPDALRVVLVAVREITPQSRLWVVFGAGGDRDRSKRSEMGVAAAKAADRLVVTNDNPRSEDPDQIIKEIVEGIKRSRYPKEPNGLLAICRAIAGAIGIKRSHYLVEPDRRKAIHRAIAEAEAGDVIVIAGKGHETTQTIGSKSIWFDDREVARKALKARLAEGATATEEAAGEETAGER